MKACIVGKYFVRTSFRSDLNLAKGTIDDLLCERLPQISQDWIKMLPIIKFYVRRFKKRLNSYIIAKPQLLEKVSWKIRQKAENIFLHNSIKISGNFDIKHLWWSKTDLSKEIKKNVLRDILWILVVIGRFNVKRCPLSLKLCHLFICISLK